MPFYCDDPKFSSLDFMALDDEQLLSFMRKEGFSVNKEWGPGNPVLHLLLANEMFNDFERFLDLIPQRINPNLCDGSRFGSKSLLIILTMLPSSDALPLKFIELYGNKINVDYQDKSGRTALHYAVILGRHDLVKALIQLGASTSIKDQLGNCALDYLNCTESFISSVLKQIDIDPDRDLYATNNKLKDHLGYPLYWQGRQLVFDKNNIEMVLQDVTLKKSHLVEYISGTESWGTFIGDQGDATRRYLTRFAQDIASEFNVPLKAVLINQTLPSAVLDDFVEFLEYLKENLSGVTVLQNCQAGQQLIAENQENERPSNSL